MDSYRVGRNTTVNALAGQSEQCLVSGGVKRAAVLGRFESHTQVEDCPHALSHLHTPRHALLMSL